MSMPSLTPSDKEQDHVSGKHSYQYTKEWETSDEFATSGAHATAKDLSQKSFCRSSSLKVQKEQTSTLSGNATATQKKIVRFADVLGLDLTNVRTFLQELPSVPKHAYEDLKNEPDVEVDEHCGESVPSTSCKSLQPTFAMPVKLADFFDRIRNQCVCLETVCILESPVRHVTGRIIVKNLDFSKSVYIRYTLDEWKTFAQVRATYVEESDHDQDPYDKFAFVIYLYDTVAVGQRVEFAVEYHCRDCVYWDNNDGNNYVLECFPTSPYYMPSYFRCSSLSPTSTSYTGEHFNSFY